MVNWKRWATLGFVTGCFIRTLPFFVVIAAALYYFGNWCIRWLRNVPKYTETCTSDIYDTKGIEYILVIIYLVIFFAIMYYTQKPGVDKH